VRDALRGEALERFADRQDAGRRLAQVLENRIRGEESVILALPRGGLPVAHEVSARLGAPLDILIVRKLGVPWQPELGFGAIATGGVVVLNDDHIKALGLSDELINDIIERERSELERRERLYLDGHEPVDIAGKDVVLIDDGIATGSTVRAALECLAQRGPARRIVACPVAASETVHGLEDEADEVVCLRMPVQFAAVGAWYDDFTPVSDAEVRDILAQAATEVTEPIE